MSQPEQIFSKIRELKLLLVYKNQARGISYNEEKNSGII